MPGEFDLIDWIRTRQRVGGDVILPAGDDLAILRPRPGELLLVGVDQVLDGVHFDLRNHDPFDVGAKVVNRNLSDCAAMACLPAALVVAVALPRGAGIELARRLYEGMEHAGAAFDCPIIGGDTATWDQPLCASVTVLGRSGGIEPARRSGARVGDFVHVSGPLGGSLLGRHLRFTPRIELARTLASRGAVTAMIDLSDGLSRDAAHIARESGVGLVIDAALLPIHDDARTLARQTGRDPLEHALHDGEDYELLICSPAEALVDCVRIGKVIDGAGVWLERDGQRRPLQPLGWEHAIGRTIGR